MKCATRYGIGVVAALAGLIFPITTEAQRGRLSGSTPLPQDVQAVHSFTVGALTARQRGFLPDRGKAWCFGSVDFGVSSSTPSPIDVDALQPLVDQIARQIEIDCREINDSVQLSAASGPRWLRRLTEANGFTLRALVGQSSASPSDLAAAARTRDQLMRRASKGDAKAGYALGLLNHLGPGQHDYQAARRWYEQAAAAGMPEANFALGALYESGHGVGLSDDRMYEYFRLAANAGHFGAMVRSSRQILDRSFIYNTQVVPDLRAAVRAGSPEAMEMLGQFYRDVPGPNGVYQMSNALKHFDDAVRGGNCMARIDLGEMHYRGEGIRQDVPKAVEWFQSAAQCPGITPGEFAFAQKSLQLARSEPDPVRYSRNSDVTPFTVMAPPAGEPKSFAELVASLFVAAVALDIAGSILNPSSDRPRTAPSTSLPNNSKDLFNEYLTRQIQCRAIAPGMC